ncbi:MAG TPA: bifunctional demethylmenaquinone methyltransferase/2-methoxy-6-polyprenyl-1,4-benzoquinol methylase UbiE [Woeseiaceae bacterium]|nr:bifunctional demethylmenaquinone methyltransferase/2-methoxy-6-polyprenyl-1,4-benzoquinol methylase UbiE [Woeseiaceae bacterium]
MPENKPAAEETHFGYQTVPVEEKADLVRGVFDSVASKYDLMNDLMSGGLHRIWKRFTIGAAMVRPGHRVLDLAGGTGDLCRTFARQVGTTGEVVLADINHAMLEQGRRRLVDAGVAGNLSIVQADAENLPFADASFDRVTMAFGLRNVTNKEAALESIYRVLKPAGKALILEFSRPMEALKPVYDLYSFKVLPVLGKIIAQDADSYRYLAESIRMHPDQDSLKDMMQAAGFERCHYHNLSGGIVALHTAYRV